jgi:hypothetical protein
MGTAKVVALSARPSKASLLCFEVGGVLGQLGAQLKDTVTPFDFTTFYAGLGATAVGDASLLVFDSAGILAAPTVSASTLATLRAEPRKAALDRAVNLRQNAFFAKYASVPAIVTMANNLYGANTSAKPARLLNLSTLAQQQADQLAAAYTADGRTGVVKNTNSTLNSKTTTTDASVSSGQSSSRASSSAHTTATGQTSMDSIGDPAFSGSQSLGDPPSGGGSFGVTITDAANRIVESFQEGSSGETSDQTGVSTGTQSGSQQSTGSAYAVETQSISNTDYGYRIPAIESQAQNERAQISLIDQQFSQFMASQNLPNLATVLQNELSAIDLGVYQLQVGLLNTILMSPITGIVTGIYKNPGDYVRPGEPVIRVEDNSTIFLLATFIHRGPIQVGSTVNVTTQLFDAAGAPTTLSGSVVAVRNRGDDDQWDLVVQCANPLDGGGKLTFPIGYTFDYDNTTASVV